jgi:hypothetical protein
MNIYGLLAKGHLIKAIVKGKPLIYLYNRQIYKFAIHGIRRFLIR